MTIDTPPGDVRRPSPAKQRILDVADRLFYTEGVHLTGIDRIIAEAEVTKATFYKQWGAKDSLIAAYITNRDTQIRASLGELAAGSPSPRATIEAVIEVIGTDTARPDFRGCPFGNIAAEFPEPGHPVRQLVREHRDWFTGFLEDLLRKAGHPHPGSAADELSLLRDGALTGAYTGDPVAATSALTAGARRLLGELPPA